MKKSHIAIWSVVGFIVLCLLIALIFGRVALGNGRDWEGSNTGYSRSSNHSESSGEAGVYIDEELNFEGFDSILVEGLWRLQVDEGSEFSIEVSYPPSWPKGSHVGMRGETLVLAYPDSGRDPDESAVAWITMPVLESLRVEGVAEADISGFDAENLDLVVEGAAQIKGMDSTVENLTLSISGAGQVDLEDMPTVNADVTLAGAAQVELRMNGGVLEGRLDGIGRIAYSGEVSREDVAIEGLGAVKYRR